jgi:hypothetical protein
MTSRRWSGIALSLALSMNAAATELGSVRALLVPTQPPGPRREVVVSEARPSPDFERIGGVWHWRGGTWVWLSPRWQRRPDRGVRWIPPEYSRLDGRWCYVPGHWSSQSVIAPARDRARHAAYLSSTRSARGRR